MNNAVYIMGVSGCGKSTVGSALAAYLGHPFLEGDDLHPPENIKKMSVGTPLTDADRWPWLEAVADQARQTAVAKGGSVAACSGLRESYRRLLSERTGTRQEPQVIVYQVLLTCDREVLRRRLRARTDHFMPESLLDSQLDTLEPPTNDERVLQINGEQELPSMIEQIAYYIKT